MNPGIFREYDIRGIAGVDLTDADVVKIGMATGTSLIREGFDSVVVGRDCRETSDLYADKIMEGLQKTGCDVIDVGVCPTPILYFAIRNLGAKGGVMVTASHNPKEYNGFKMCKGTDSIHGDGIRNLYTLIENNDFETGNGTRTQKDAATPYSDYLKKNINIGKKLNIGVDAGNGTGGFLSVPVLEHFGCNVHELYCDMDGTFPNHPSDPTVAENMQDLIALVKKEGLDLGVGYDGDADRIGIVDEKGNLVYGDQLMIVFAREILTRKPGAVFISEVKCSQTMYNDIEKHGGKAIMWKTGHSLIKAKMKEEGAALAGEMSGHMFFEDRYFGYDDALYATLRLLEILADTGKTMSELLCDIPETHNTPEIRVDCADDVKFGVVEKITAHFKKTHNVIDIDGMRVLFDDGWGLVRASNTQPSLVLRFEALSMESLSAIRKKVESVLADIIENN